MRAAVLGDIEGQSTPAAADVADVVVGFNEQLGENVPLLCALSFLQSASLLVEIGARILSIGIEEERIETLVEIVVMGHVAPGLHSRIVQRQCLEGSAHALAELAPLGRPSRRDVLADQIQEFVDRAGLSSRRPSMNSSPKASSGSAASICGPVA